MREWPAWPWFLLSLLGLGLIGDAVLRGAATLEIVVIVPVITGGSPEFLTGVGLTFLGFLAGGFAASRGPSPEERSEIRPGRPTSNGSDSPRFGGVVLVGPVPIFFGNYRPGTTARWAWALVGLGLLVAAVVALIYFR